MKLRTGIIGLGMVLSFAMGCGGSTGKLPDPNVRFINFCSDASLDLLIDDTTKFTGVTFLDASTLFQTTDPKLEDFSIVETLSTVVIDSQATAMTSNSDNLVIAFGLNNFGTENEKRLRFSFQPVNRALPNGSKARVYAMNTFCRSTGNQNFAVIFKNPGTISTINFNPVNFGEVTLQEIDAGPTTLTAQRQSTETEIATVTKNFEAGKIYFMALTGVEGGVGVKAPTINFIEIPVK